MIYLIIFLAGIFNAIQDTIRHHWDTSIFTRIKSLFWFRWFRSDWRDKPKHSIWFLWDAWHFFKSLERICYLTIIFLLSGNWFITFGCLVCLGIGFNLFYHHLLIYRKNN